jgi:integrase
VAGKRRGSGEGTIFKRKDGRWAGSVTVGYDQAGRRRRHTVYGAKRSEVHEKLVELQNESRSGIVAEPGRVSVAQFLERWLHDSARTRLRPSTLRLYTGLVRNHINPRIGGVQLRKLGPEHVQALHSVMEQSGASPRLRQIVHNLLNHSLRQALRWGLVSRNSMDVVDRPRASRREMRHLDPDQVVQLLAAANGERFEALYVLAVTTGLRQGELLGLQWGDVDWQGQSLSVRRQLIENNGRFELAEPKTTAARRKVELPSMAVEALERHRVRLGAVPHSTKLIFTDSQGGPVRKSNLVRRSFKPLLERARLPDIRFHDLRHTAASLALALDIHPKVISERLGHASVGITLDLYSHVLPSLQREAADRLDSLLTKGS